MSTTEIVRKPTQGPANALQLSDEQINLVTRTVAQGADRDELQLFLHTANRMGLDPLAKQIHAVKRWDSRAKREVMSIQVGIDGLRLVAERTGVYLGQEGPFWCGEDGQWREVWTGQKPPVAAKVVVRRAVGQHVSTMSAVAHWGEYVATKRDGAPTNMWASKPALMLAKCAEALALRKAFPAEMSGAYTHDEMQQADADRPPVQQPSPTPPPIQVAAPQESQAVADLREKCKDAGLTTEQIEALADDAMVPDAPTLRERMALATRAQVVGMIAAIAFADQEPPSVDGDQQTIDGSADEDTAPAPAEGVMGAER